MAGMVIGQGVRTSPAEAAETELDVPGDALDKERAGQARRRKSAGQILQLEAGKFGGGGRALKGRLG